MSAGWRTSGLLLAAALATGGAAAPDGAAVYVQQCALCHQANAGGAPGQYPPLRNRVDKIAGSPEGRVYVSHVLLNGMAGVITAAGARYVGYMPSFRQLPDAAIAAVLSYVSGLGDSRPAPVLTEAAIAAERGRVLSPVAVNAERSALAAQHPLP